LNQSGEHVNQLFALKHPTKFKNCQILFHFDAIAVRLYHLHQLTLR